MPTPALLLLIATLLPLAGFALLVFAAKRIGNPLAGWVGTLFISISFGCTLAAMVSWFAAEPGHYLGSEWGEGYGPISIPIKWLPVGISRQTSGITQVHPGYLDLGIYVDSLTILLCAAITLVATLVHIFSIGYMRQEIRFERFFTLLSLFSFSMLALVLGGTLLQILICWELVGLCAYLLIGFWYESPAACNAAIKAAIVQRIGDVAFLIGCGILFCYLGNASLPEIWAYLGTASGGHSVPLPGGGQFGLGLLTITGICLFVGAMASSAQFPLQVWIPDASEAPAPVNALIQSVMLAAAGVYLVARMFPILTPTARLFIAIIGLITLTMSALIATVQNNIQRLLAYSTTSQFGYMMLAMGIGSWVGGLFHLIAHAFFKSLLFLAAGSVIRAAGREQDMAKFGGLWRRLPITAFTFGLAVLAMAGTPYLAGSIGKSMILTHAAAFTLLARGEGHSRAYALFFILPAAVSVLTAFYIGRCWMLTFWGKPRDQALCDGAREYPIMWAPLCALAFIIVVGGLYFSVSVQPLLESSIKETQAVCHDIQLRDSFFQSRPDFAGFARTWPGTPATGSDDRLSSMVAAGSELQHRWLQYGTLIGIALAALVYIRGYSLTRWFMQIPPIRWIHRWLAAGMYFDELYLALVVGFVWFIARLCAWFDRRILERSVDRFGRFVRRAARAVAPGERAAGGQAFTGQAATGGSAGGSAGMMTPPVGQLNLSVTLLMVATVLIFTAVALLEWNR
jgi:proton-translocating NADH-quinone oxidoreductase chain L